ncbi:MAG: di-heme enzyme [Gammaproteobacteria bacterium]|nr:di-heme enzyme [Gammaproteobacteria bacterium]MDH5304386.1 di-heme enzyme [Gammaproteobacteria bacterium]MDH5322111.1 di-heme enzyme [Gammaproteobacteria bacterium]
MRKLFLLSMAVIIGTLYWLLRERGYEWTLPEHLPRPSVPADNPMSAAKVALGRRLFYDTRLSVNNTNSCGSCHQQALAFTDGRPRAVGATGQLHPRASMSLVNVAYLSRLTWANPLLEHLEDQALTPMFGDNPIEMGMGGREHLLVDLLRSDAAYKAALPAVFPDDEDPFSVLNAVRAIAAFVRSIVSFDSPYDRYVAGDLNALSVSAERGMQLFFSERLECFHCHGGFNFTDSTTHENTRVDSVGFHNTGLYNLDGSGAYPTENTGLYDMTGERRDMGRFRAPTLRNIELTAPYMHDGSVATLEDVIAHYERGGRLISDGPYAGDGRLNPFKSEFIRGFELSADERHDLLSFLHALTDTSLVQDPALSDPFAAP